MSNTFYSEIVADQNFAAMLSGLTYRWFDFQTLIAEDVKEYLIYVPEDVDIWFYGRAFSGRGTNITLEIFANPTFSSEGILMSSRIFNRNSQSSRTAVASVWEDPVITSDGSLSDYDEVSGSTDSSSGVKGSQGSQASQDFPRIMPKGTYFLARVTNLSANNPGSYVYKLFWSEIPTSS